MLRFSLDARNQAANAFADMLNNGTVTLFTGNRPILVSEPLTAGQTALAHFGLRNPAFEPAVNGEVVSSGGRFETQAIAKGEARWARLLTANGEVVADMLVRTADAPDVEDAAIICSETPDLRRRDYLRLPVIRYRAAGE